jgi:cobalamin synthase
MERDSRKGIKGWLLVYLIGSIPLLIMYSMGLSGWFFEYPFILMVTIFLVLTIPLCLIILKSSKAPQWNISMWWTIVVLMTLRSISVFLEPGGKEMSIKEMLSVALTLLVIVSISLVWAIIWTKYFKKSIKVRNTFY